MQHEKGCLQKCQAARSQLTSVQNFTLPHLTRLSCEWLQSGKRVDLSTQDCVKLYVSSDDSRNPCPTHTSDSSACACSHTILLGVSERQSQTKCTNLLSCFLLFNWKGSNKCDLSAKSCQWLLITYLCDKGSDCRTFSGVATMLRYLCAVPRRSKVQEKQQLSFAACEFQKMVNLRLVSPCLTFPRQTNPGIGSLMNLRLSTITCDYLRR